MTCGLLCAILAGCQTAVGAELSEIEYRTRAVLDLMSQGRELLLKGNCRQAAMEFEKVLSLDPSNSAAAHYVGRCEQCMRGKKE